MIDSKINQNAKTSEEHLKFGVKSYCEIFISENKLKELKEIRWSSESIKRKPEEIEREIEGIENRMVEPSTGEMKSYDLVNLKKAKEHFTKAIGLDSGNQIALNFRGQCFMKEENYGEATNDFYKILEQDPENSEALKLVSECLMKMGKYEKAFEYLDKVINTELENATLFCHRGECYFNFKNFELAIKDFTKAIELEPNNDDAFYTRGLCYKNMQKYQDALVDISKAIELGAKDDYTLGEYYETRSSIYEILNEIDLAIEDLRKLENIGDDRYRDSVFHIEKLRVQQERDRIISNLSHSIKNLIASVIDPLENMQRNKTYNSYAIENALKGTNLVRELVNAMNLSYNNSLEDFLFDAMENSDSESLSLEQIILEALKYSVGNMFDGKYFSTFLRNYFSSEEIFIEAKELWTTISQTKDFQKLKDFLQKYFFTFDLNLQEANELVIGNRKGSRIKFTILFQEMLLNAVKYSSFVPKEKREIKVSLFKKEDEITFEIKNSFKENEKTKSTGLGLEIIKNFAKLLKSNPEVRIENKVYSTSITFQNLWRN